jgi:NAD(P)-dependent dehydrogenase (short-subunit alcohol dehydrogenase family)
MTTRVALVTGGTGGIGTAICRHLATLGHKVATNYRDEAKAKAWQDAQRKDGFDFALAKGDVADAATAESMVREVEKQLGPVDILINNAGITRDTTFHKMNALQWQEVIATNLGSCFNVTRPVIDGMRERKWGRIVNVLNIGAKAPGADSTPTSVSRAAGLALTKALSKENAPHNVLVNAMLVGLIESDQWVRRHKALGKDQTFQQFIDGMAKGRVPIGRMGKAEEFARMACFLCSDAGSFITGVAINVDGGASPVV